MRIHNNDLVLFSLMLLPGIGFFLTVGWSIQPIDDHWLTLILANSSVRMWMGILCTSLGMVSLCLFILRIRQRLKGRFVTDKGTIYFQDKKLYRGRVICYHRRYDGSFGWCLMSEKNMKPTSPETTFAIRIKKLK